MVGIIEDKPGQILKVKLPLLSLRDLSHNPFQQSSLYRNLQFYQHCLQFLPCQLPVLVHIELVKYLPQNKLLVSVVRPLQQLKPQSTQSRLHLLHSSSRVGLVLETPLPSHKSSKGVVTGNIHRQISVKINKLLVSHVTLPRQLHQAHQLLQNRLLRLKAQLELLESLRVESRTCIAHILLNSE